MSREGSSTEDLLDREGSSDDDLLFREGSSTEDLSDREGSSDKSSDMPDLPETDEASDDFTKNFKKKMST